MNKHFLIYSKDWGVYLGSCMGLGFWSKLDPVGQSEACVFENHKQANEHMKSWDSQPPSDTCLLEVNTQNGQYATLAECMMAGVEHWNPLESNEPNTIH